MNVSREITCSMCGHRFVPAAHGACQSCPLNSGCTLTCCPNCGYENVDIQQSSLARLASRLFRRLHLSPHPSPLPPHPSPLPKGEGVMHPIYRLSEVQPGRRTRVVDFLPGLPADRRAQLQAYGLTPGYSIQVVQHSPVTIIQIDQTELALEPSLAYQVQVGD